MSPAGGHCMSLNDLDDQEGAVIPKIQSKPTKVAQFEFGIPQTYDLQDLSTKLYLEDMS